MPGCRNLSRSPALALTVFYVVLSSTAGTQEAADHVAMGIAGCEVRDLRTALQHYQAALDQDPSNYEADWRAAITLLTLGEQLPQSPGNPERDSLYALAEHYALLIRETMALTTSWDGGTGKSCGHPV